MKDKVPRNRSNGQAVLSVEIVQKQSIYGYHGEKKAMFLKITGIYRLN